jgi:hypothetical protein
VLVDRGHRSGTGRGECGTSRGAAGVVGESKEMVGVQEGGCRKGDGRCHSSVA